jgi:hypothetical protein
MSMMMTRISLRDSSTAIGERPPRREPDARTKSIRGEALRPRTNSGGCSVPAEVRPPDDGWRQLEPGHSLGFPTVSAACAPRAPRGAAGPVVVSRAVWCSISASSSAPSKITIDESHIQVMRPITAPTDP